MGCVSRLSKNALQSADRSTARAVFALDITSKDSGSVARAVYHDFVPAALEKSSLTCKPDPHVAGEGLKDVQTGLDVHRRGVSAKKVVISGIQA